MGYTGILMPDGSFHACARTEHSELLNKLLSDEYFQYRQLSSVQKIPDGGACLWDTDFKFISFEGDSYINGELGKVNKTYLKNEKTGDYWLINEEVIKLPIPAQSVSCKNKEAVDFNQSLYKDMDIEESFEAIQSGILTVSVPDTVSNQQKQFDGEVGVIKKTIAVSKETGDKTVLIKEVIKLPTPGFSVVTDGLFENNNIIIKNKNLSLLIFRD